MPRLVLISDTHFLHHEVDVPDGDILIHAGDSLGHGTLDELKNVNEWLGSLPHKYKILISGNHDWCFEKDNKAARQLVTNAIYLQDSAVKLSGFKIYGSPWQPRFFDWAFNLDRGEPLAKVWAKIPDDTDILVTHGAPYKILDRTEHNIDTGCEDLLRRIEAVKPRLHLFGHIHEGYGEREIAGTKFVNASICDVRYRARNSPIVLDLKSESY